MPYKSDAQRKFMHAQHPEIAERWDKEHDVPKDLPEYVKQRQEHHNEKAHGKKK